MNSELTDNELKLMKYIVDDMTKDDIKNQQVVRIDKMMDCLEVDKATTKQILKSLIKKEYISIPDGLEYFNCNICVHEKWFKNEKDSDSK